MLALALPGLAQSSSVKNWTNPGSFPFTGTLTEACDLHRDNLTSEQCLRAMSRYEAGTCDTMYLQDGDIIDVSFTAGGVHKKSTLRVMFGDQYGPEDPIRLAQACSTGRSDGLYMVRPQVCGNWSAMTVPLPSTPISVPEEPERKIRYETVQVCTDVPISSYTPGYQMSVPGVGFSDDCGNLFYTGPLSSQTSGTTSVGTRRICEFMTRRIEE